MGCVSDKYCGKYCDVSALGVRGDVTLEEKPVPREGDRAFFSVDCFYRDEPVVYRQECGCGRFDFKFCWRVCGGAALFWVAETVSMDRGVGEIRGSSIKNNRKTGKFGMGFFIDKKIIETSKNQIR